MKEKTLVFADFPPSLRSRLLLLRRLRLRLLQAARHVKWFFLFFFNQDFFYCFRSGLQAPAITSKTQKREKMGGVHHKPSLRSTREQV